MPRIQLCSTLSCSADFSYEIYVLVHWVKLMTLRHSFDFIQYSKIQNVLCFLFCFTLRPFTVVGANSEKENLMWASLTLPWLRLEQLPFSFLVVLLDSFPLMGD